MADVITAVQMRLQSPSDQSGRSFFYTRHGLSGIGHHLSGQLYEPLKVHEAYQPIPK
jgi:hypothetical protein